MTFFWIVYKRCRRRQKRRRKREGEVIQFSQTVREFVLLRVVRLARIGVGHRALDLRTLGFLALRALFPICKDRKGPEAPKGPKRPQKLKSRNPPY